MNTSERHQLFVRFEHFFSLVEAATVPLSGGARRVAGIAHAVALSESTAWLFRALADATNVIIRDHGKPIVGLPPGISLGHSHTIDGPYEAIPTTAMTGYSMPVGGGGADPVLMAGLESAFGAVAFPVRTWNALQAARPGGPHERWRPGDILLKGLLDKLEAARKLLRMSLTGGSPPADVQDASIIDVAVWVSSSELRDKCGLNPGTVAAAAKRKHWPRELHRRTRWYRRVDVRGEWPVETNDLI